MIRRYLWPTELNFYHSPGVTLRAASRIFSRLTLFPLEAIIHYIKHVDKHVDTKNQQAFLFLFFKHF